jgi:Ca-activated chloride channel family protein
LASAPQPDPVAGLIDIALPAPISLWPQTWPLRIVLVVAAVALVSGAWCFFRWWHRNRYRREALAELDRIEAAIGEAPSPGAPEALASLVRRTALAAFPREQIASLAGPAWLAFLDCTADTHDFSAGAGQALEAEAYRPAPGNPIALPGAVRHWIRAHHA